MRQIRKGISLRAVATALGYSPSALVEHRRNGAFKALPDGSYDLQSVASGLLTYTLPSPEHKAKLEANKAPARTVSRTDDVEDDEEDVVLTEQQEAGIQAVMKHLKTEEFRLALNVIDGLPLKIARDMVKADPDMSFLGAVKYFEDHLVDTYVRYVFDLVRKKREKEFAKLDNEQRQGAAR